MKSSNKTLQLDGGGLVYHLSLLFIWIQWSGKSAFQNDPEAKDGGALVPQFPTSGSPVEPWFLGISCFPLADSSFVLFLVLTWLSG